MDEGIGLTGDRPAWPVARIGSVVLGRWRARILPVVRAGETARRWPGRSRPLASWTGFREASLGPSAGSAETKPFARTSIRVKTWEPRGSRSGRADETKPISGPPRSRRPLASDRRSRRPSLEKQSHRSQVETPLKFGRREVGPSRAFGPRRFGRDLGLEKQSHRPQASVLEEDRGREVWFAGSSRTHRRHGTSGGASGWPWAARRLRVANCSMKGWEGTAY